MGNAEIMYLPTLAAVVNPDAVETHWKAPTHVVAEGDWRLWT